MQLGFGITASALEQSRNFSMIKTLYIVQEKDAAVPGRHSSQGAINVEAVDYAGLHQITSAEATASTLFRDLFNEVIERYNSECALSQVHQHSVDSESMKPRGKGRVAAKECDLSMDLKKCFLGEILGKREVSHHAHTDCKNAPLVLIVKLRECIMIAGLGTIDNIGLLALSLGFGRFASQGMDAC
jgi:hypothetical protein